MIGDEILEIFTKMGLNDSYTKRFFSLAFKHKGYIPTLLKTFLILKSASFKPWSDKNDRKEMENPFQSEKERKDLIERANWLCENVIVKDPEELIKKMPEFIGRQFQGQWAIYACSMTAFALCNLIRIYPDTKKQFIDKLPKLINLVNTPTIRYYDTEWWNEDAMESLNGNQSHMTYLSILAWMIGNYKLAGGDDRFDDIHTVLCETLDRRMNSVPDCNLPSFPNGTVFFPDMMFAVIALKDYEKLHNKSFDSTINRWLYHAKNEYINPATGLLWSCYFRNHTQGRTSGAYSGLNTTGLTLIDEGFAYEQYQKLKKSLVIEFGKYASIKEYFKDMPQLSFDMDAGPVLFGLSPTGTSFSLGAATFFEVWELRKKLLNTAELAGHTIKRKNKRHYKLAEILLTGEAITLGMRTMVNFNKWK